VNLKFEIPSGSTDIANHVDALSGYSCVLVFAEPHALTGARLLESSLLES
jgi:hypothetical protein